ncbi:QacE family quaternary ammonium compound efflux SMR transporter [Enterobacter sp. 10-1]|uniref:DMT family transporter n=1 Tax=Raoultella sp. 10-1 TaxID=2683201 RepID=UPI000BA2EACB|nr:MULTISPECIES: SMR family transporter [Enterobacteriaceae]MVT05851.1 QacE family quaternary ammonium compound efflux SMR transporter [Raoultella sp. 10-1]PAC07697.1 QacE family quaternary ammonium compound efflux SMR transporter [Enterobacter sp. 10-1]
MMAVLIIVFWLFISVLFEVIGTSLLIKTKNFTRVVPSLIVVFSYLGAFYALAQTMVLIRPGLAYALWCGLGILLVAASGLIFYQQKPDRAGMSGLGLIVAGCMIMGIFG